MMQRAPYAAMVISEKKSKAMHVHPMTRVSATKEAEVVAMKLKYVCDSLLPYFSGSGGTHKHLVKSSCSAFRLEDLRPIGMLVSFVIMKRENLDSNDRHNAIHKYRKSITNYMIE